MATTVEEWLNSIGLGKYAEVFAANDVDLRALPHLDAADLQELGVSLGHRKIILNEIAALRGSGPREIETRAQDRPAPAVAAPPVASEADAIGEGSPDLRLLSVLSATWSLRRPCRVDSTAEEMHELDQRVSGRRRDRGYAFRRLRRQVSWRRRACRISAGRWLTRTMPSARSAPALRRLTQLTAQTARRPAARSARIGIASGHVVVGDIAGSGANDRGQIAGRHAQSCRALAEPLRAGPDRRCRQSRAASRAKPSTSRASARSELKGFKSACGRVPGARRTRGGKPLRCRPRRRPFEIRRPEQRNRHAARALGARQRAARAKRYSCRARQASGNRASSKRSRNALQQEQHELIRLQCSPYHTTSALYPIIQRLSRFAGSRFRRRPIRRGRRNCARLSSVLRGRPGRCRIDLCQAPLAGPR